MAAVTATVEVARPAPEVFAYATDPSRFHQWQKSVVDGHSEAPAEARVGDRCVSVRRIGFAKRPCTSEITSVTAPQHWSVRGIDGPIRALVTVDVEPLTEHQSRLTIALDFEGHGIGRLLVPMIVIPEARKEMPNNLDQLRRILEEPKG